MIHLKIKVNSGEKQTVNLFFVELIISLLFFSFSGAVVLRVFAYADSRARLGQVLEKASLCAQSAAEAYSVSGSRNDAFSAVFGEDNERPESGVILLDSGCRPSESGSVELSYSEEVTEYKAGELRVLSLSFRSAGEEIYALECSAYIPAGGADDE